MYIGSLYISVVGKLRWYFVYNLSCEENEMAIGLSTLGSCKY